MCYRSYRCNTVSCSGWLWVMKFSTAGRLITKGNTPLSLATYHFSISPSKPQFEFERVAGDLSCHAEFRGLNYYFC